MLKIALLVLSLSLGSVQPKQSPEPAKTAEATKQNTAEVAVPVRNPTQTVDERIADYTRLLAWFTGGLLFATGVLALFTARLWITTRSLVDDARSNAERQLRAYVSVRSGEFMNQITTEKYAIKFKFTPIIVNSGQTPAYDVQCVAKACISRHLSTASDFTLPESNERRFGAVGPQQQVPFNVWAEEHYPAEVIGELAPKGDKWLYLYGTIKYRDAFAVDRTTEFCYWITKGAGRIPSVWNLDAFHNNAD